MSAMIDMAISLALVYLMMAGVVSGMQEMVASTLQLRGKQLQRGIASLLHEAMVTTPVPGSLLARFYAHPLIDSLSDGTRRPAYIPSASFAVVLADALVSEQGVHQPLFQGLPEAVARMPDTPLRRTLQTMVAQANGQAQALQAALEQHFDNVMSRVSGWYKRRTQWITFTLALGLAVVMNVDSIELMRYLTRNPGQAGHLAEIAARRVQEAPPAAPVPAEPASASVALVVQQGAQAQREAQALLNLPLPLGWDFDKLESSYHERRWPSPATMLMVLAGWLITALASTLGAPFWFDLLSRLVPLRSSGKPPPRSAVANPASPEPATPPNPPAAAPATVNPASASPAEGSDAASSEDAVAGTSWTATGTVTPGAASSPGARNDFEARQLNELDLFALQRALGMDAGALSGHLDETTRQALRHWQIFQNLPANGEFDEIAVMRLLYPDDASGG